MVRYASAAIVAALLIACTGGVPSTTPMPIPTAVTGPAIETDRPALATSAPDPSPCSRPTPTLVPALAFQNGNLDLNVPYELGFVQFNLVPCRDIEAVRAKYGLGPATRVIDGPPDPVSDPDDVRSRYYRARVPAGAEAAFVTRLFGHPEDFQYVEFAMVSVACVMGCAVASTVEPTEAAAGASFTMRICCFDEGTSVTKTFVLPSGRTIVLADAAGADRTVPAAWGGSAGDERGVYTVTVTSRDIGSTVRFRIR